MSIYKHCPSCGNPVAMYRNPFPTVDTIIHFPPGRIVLVERKNPPPGWALPGGFVDYGETVEAAAVREVLEETGLKVTLTDLLGVYSHPDRDPRQHNMSVVFVAHVEAGQELSPGDDADSAGIFDLQDLPELAFDHRKIINDFVYRLKRLK
ncbi:NUDIX hydrolase [Desulfonatronospira sp.]|uniref:NUDIX hydrolase n=1 Tax=Desulfonatronospira sp. TaxID=1962951 RepID=UPI0025BBCED2|nr:NUDIX hydrolase [Desulfonatronospira sp.]